MIVLLVALCLAALTFMLAMSFFGIVAAILPAVVVFMAAYFIIARKVAKTVEGGMLRAQSEMQKGRIERGMQILNELKQKYKYWQFFTAGSINGQIGSIYYIRQEHAKAKPYLEKSFVRHWVAKGMLGALLSKKKDFKAMDKVFENTLRYSSKQGLLWSLWAYCHWKAGNQEKAIDILLKGQKKIGAGDSKLSVNLINLQNNKKMKMRGYGEQWYQFNLEVSPQMKQMRTRQVRYKQR